MITIGRDLPKKHLDEFCWRIVRSAIDFECRLTLDDGKWEDEYGFGMMNQLIDDIEFFYHNAGVDVIRRAKMHDEIVPIWIQEEGLEVEPRMENGTFTCIPEEGL